MLQFYKPNAKNNGHACSIYYSTSNECFFLEILKQCGWDGKNGKFKDSKSNPAHNLKMKLSTTEAADMLETIDKGSECKFYHDYPGGKYKISGNFVPYSTSDNKPAGFSLSLFKADKQDSTPTGKGSFRIGFYFKEARLLKEYILIGLREILIYKPKETADKPEQEAPKTAE